MRRCGITGRDTGARDTGMEGEGTAVGADMAGADTAGAGAGARVGEGAERATFRGGAWLRARRSLVGFFTPLSTLSVILRSQPACKGPSGFRSLFFGDTGFLLVL